MHAAAVAVSALTLALHAQKAMWNRFSLLLLIHYKFTLPQIGAVKLWSMLVKMVLQVAVPAVDDGGLFQRFLPAQTSAHVLSVAAALAGVPTVIAFERACASGNLHAVVAVKSAASVLSSLLGLADGIITRTVQVQRRPYAHTQVAHALARAFAVFGGGVVMDVFGATGVFYALSALKLLAALCLVVMATWWPLSRSTHASSTGGGCCAVVGYLRGASLVKHLACLCALWGLCFVLVETFTITQMDTELGFSKSTSGFASMLAVLSGVPVYVRAPAIIASHGHRWLIAFGLCTAIVFAFAQSFVHVRTAALAVVLCPLRGVAYAAIWAALMDMLVRDVKNEFMASVQALVMFAWFTLGNDLGYLLWAHLYEQLHAPLCYALCAGVLALSSVLVPGLQHNVPRSQSCLLATVVMVMVVAVSWRIAYMIWVQALENDSFDPGRYARLWASAIHSRNGSSSTHDEQHARILARQQDTIHTRVTQAPMHTNPQHASNDNAHDGQYAPHLAMQDGKVHTPVSPAQVKTKNINMPLHEYVQHRIAHTDPRQYARFADRLWLNEWRKVARCGARVPAILAFFDARNVSLLAHYKGPASGAVVKLNHMAGYVHILAAGSSLSTPDVTQYATLVQQSYRRQEPHYGFVRHGVIIEEFISAFKTSVPPDYKTYAFDGTIALVRIHYNRRCSVVRGTYACHSSYLYVDPTHTHTIPLSHHGSARYTGEFKRPCGWNATMQSAACISSGINFARVDMYIVDCMPFLGEFTMTPLGGNLEVADGGSAWLGSFVHSEQLFPQGEAFALV